MGRPTDLVTYHVVVRRDLVSVRAPKTVLGSVVVDGDFIEWTGAAPGVIGGLVRELGKEDAARLVMAEGWANGAGLYLTDAVPGR